MHFILFCKVDLSSYLFASSGKFLFSWSKREKQSLSGIGEGGEKRWWQLRQSLTISYLSSLIHWIMQHNVGVGCDLFHSILQYFRFRVDLNFSKLFQDIPFSVILFLILQEIIKTYVHYWNLQVRLAFLWIFIHNEHWWNNLREKIQINEFTWSGVKIVDFHITFDQNAKKY